METNTPAGVAPALQMTEAVERNVVVTGNRIDSRELFADQRELLISHGDDIYRLRLTFQNKLILTK
ncbi:hemin uptake protein HemP [Tardiphaga sp.]|uniref:hemin uptake protein HemP n=1 Tax=Tardiphaga sp. TaxID=1926292 RepID=UPI00262AB621|nr:hemin uptake protein HemP [Tardiphaga sp.]MDB5619414.1 hemin transporter HemP [Tardiphaga sp.]